MKLFAFTKQLYIKILFPYRKAIFMTPLGLYLAKKSVNKAEISRKTGISKSRLSELSMNQTAKLRADELYLIALAIDADPCEVLLHLFNDLKLKS
jgi:DNA-binding Xre family transcriptional regulator